MKTNQKNDLHSKAEASICRLMGHPFKDEAAWRRSGRETMMSSGGALRLLEEARNLQGIESVLKSIARVTTVGELVDRLNEILIGLIFKRLEFSVQLLQAIASPFPDIVVRRDRQKAYVEVTRMHPPHPRNPPKRILQAISRREESCEDVLEPYGTEAEVKDAEDRIRGKFRQIQAVKPNKGIIAVWSDRDYIEDLEFEEAMGNIRRSSMDETDGRSFPDNLLFCMFASPVIAFPQRQQVYCYPVGDLDASIRSWLRELQESLV